MIRYAIAALVALEACPPAPVTIPDSGDTSPAGVCAHLAALTCAEGQAPNCAAVFAHAQDSGLTDLKPACLASATTKEAARKCGSVQCK